MHKLLFVLFSLCSLLSYSQDFKNYDNLRSQGKIPLDLLTSSNEKYEKSLGKEISENDKRKTRKSKEKFLLISSYELREMLFSGKVMFNDTLSRYVNSVSNELLKNEPELKKKIRFYIYKSSVANGFATNDGMIFITLGMLSQIETEAQLAFILAHEIAHYKLKHNINGYVKKEEIAQEKGFRGSSSEDIDLKKNQYSRELETEADANGLKLFLNSDYSTEGIERVFDILKYSYLPFDDVEFDKTLYQDNYYKFPDDYWVEELNPIATEQEYNEKKSSHPSPDRRKSKIKSRISASTDDSQKSKHLVLDKAYFLYMRNVARFEVAKVLLYEEDYATCIYHTFLLSKEFNNNAYLNEMQTLAFYYLFKSTVDSEFSKSKFTLSLSKDIEGEMHRLTYLLDQLSVKELGVLSLKITLENELKDPKNEILKKVANDLMYTLVRDLDLDPDDFLRSYPTKPMVEDSNNNEEKSKLDKINDQETTVSYYNYALVNLYNKGTAFSERFDRASDLAKLSIKKKNDTKVDYEAQKKERKLERIEGKAFNINTHVVVDPSYNKINETKKDAIRYQASEEAQEKLEEHILEQSVNAGLKTDVISRLKTTSNDLQNFNDLVLLNNWIGHSISFMDKADTSFFVSIDERRIQELISRRKTVYYTWTGLTNIRIKNDDVAFQLCFALFNPITFPIEVVKAITPDYSTSYYILTFNLETKKPVWFNYDEIENDDSKMIVKSILYDSFTQLHNKR